MTTAPTLLSKYRVKLAYGRDLYGHRAVIRYADGREADVPFSEYTRMVRAALPKDVNVLYPTVRVGTYVLAMLNPADAYAGTTIVRITKVTKNTLTGVPVHLSGEGEPTKADHVVHVYPSERMALAHVEAAETAELNTLDREIREGCAAWTSAPGWNLYTPRPAALDEKFGRRQAIRDAIIAKYNLDWREADEVFGIYN